VNDNTNVTHEHLRTLEAADNPAADVARLILRHEGELPTTAPSGVTGNAAAD
jgi:hypothetical protein